MCAHRGPFDGDLICTRPDDGHDPDATTGHTYTATWAPDAHDESEA